MCVCGQHTSRLRVCVCMNLRCVLMYICSISAHMSSVYVCAYECVGVLVSMYTCMYVSMFNGHRLYKCLTHNVYILVYMHIYIISASRSSLRRRGVLYMYISGERSTYTPIHIHIFCCTVVAQTSCSTSYAQVLISYM